MDQGKATFYSGVMSFIGYILAALIGLYAVKLQIQNSTLKGDNTQLQEQIAESDSVESDNSKLIIDLQKEVETLNTQKADLENDNKEIQAENERLQAENEELKAENKRLDEQIEELKSDDGAPSSTSDEADTDEWIELLPYKTNDCSDVYDGRDSSAFFTVGGNNKTKGIVMKFTTPGWAEERCYALWNAEGKYKTMKFKLYSIGDCNDSLTVLVNNEPYDTYELKWDDPEREFTVSLDYARNVKLELHEMHSAYGIYDIKFS